MYLVLLVTVATSNYISGAVHHGGQLVTVGIWCWWPWWLPATTCLASSSGRYMLRSGGHVCPDLEDTCPGCRTSVRVYRTRMSRSGGHVCPDLEDTYVQVWRSRVTVWRPRMSHSRTTPVSEPGGHTRAAQEATDGDPPLRMSSLVATAGVSPPHMVPRVVPPP